MALLGLALPVTGRSEQAPHRGARGVLPAPWRCDDHAAISVLSARRRSPHRRFAHGVAVCGADRGRCIGLPLLEQSRGSGAVGFLFGSIMAAWFATSAVGGFVHLMQYPRAPLALSRNYALAYAGDVGPGLTFAVLGSGLSRRLGARRCMQTWATSGGPRSESAGSTLRRPLLPRFISGKARCAGRSGGGGDFLSPLLSEIAVGLRNPSDDGCNRIRESGRAVRRLRARSASHQLGAVPRLEASDVRRVCRPGRRASVNWPRRRSCSHSHPGFARQTRWRCYGIAGRAA